MSASFAVVGTAGAHRARAVTEEVGALNGERAVTVTLSNGRVTVESDDVIDMVSDIGRSDPNRLRNRRLTHHGFTSSHGWR